MTLYKQILITITTLFLLMFVGTVYINVISATQFLEDQLESHAQDSATALGLSMSPHMLEKDLATMRSMVDAIFDRGYYKSIRIVSTDDKVLVDRQLPVAISNVPAWFISNVPLRTPEADALVMSGWNQAAKVYVSSHPGYAYSELWRTTINILLWFSITAILLAVSLVLALRVLLNPLKKVEEQAVALTQKQYVVQEHIPRTRELKRVVLAMNRMTNKVKSMFAEQASTAERLRDMAYRDGVTGLGNRRYFESQLQQRLDSGRLGQGALILLQTNELSAINAQHGYEAGDALLCGIAERIEMVTAGHNEIAIARLTGGDFGVFMQDVTMEVVNNLVSQLASDIYAMSVDGVNEPVSVNMGVVIHSADVDISTLMSKADSALRIAQRSRDISWYIYQTEADEDTSTLSRAALREKIESALDNDLFSLYRQSVRDINDMDSTLQQEVFARISGDGDDAMPASMFMTLAEDSNLASAIDKYMIQSVIVHSRSEESLSGYTLNISPSSLQDREFTDWLYTRLTEITHSEILTFECSEEIVARSDEEFRMFIEVLRTQGCAVGLDHFGRGFHDMAYLHAVRPAYVKIDAAYTRDIVDNPDNQFFVTALTGVAHSLDITVIAQAVETSEQLEMLRSLNVDAVQGYLIETPSPL